MTEHDALLQNILDEPSEDFPRLMYADWLEEHGFAVQAEFIQTQCKLAKLGECQQDFSAGLSCCCTFCSAGGFVLSRRERKLLEAHEGDWAPQELGPFAAHGGYAFTFCRGFVENVKCTLEEFLVHGQAIVRKCPLRKVKLTDKEPDTATWTEQTGFPKGTIVYGWFPARVASGGGRSWIPEKIFNYISGGVRAAGWHDDRMKWFASREDAYTCLSDALIGFVHKTDVVRLGEGNTQ